MHSTRADPKKRSKIFISKELHRMTKSPSENYSVGLLNDCIYTWEVLIIGPKDTIYENALLRGVLVFPETYPEDPPSFKFLSPMWHPNIDKDGNLCISILHKSGDDEYGYEDASERWMPVRDIESVLFSIMLLLVSPNSESPANLEAAQEFQKDLSTYNKKVRRLAQSTLEQ
ncbi:ubiquitin-conjugating enzyme E2 G1 [Nematocida homosporus]|uniref:ubiquitin-conjugating enzyme E2 G1 n=1 Tax=Nematocida homosporus TaxID=1912981 RepID=UPI00221EEFB7|nr:ubiquitin-conjugating enzyme E2 G1 [Nematocida homosporus]KAI5184923.1 ubiquitin-conjugating enzyme E2 G1 [Nematocida homosporus]